MDGTTYNIYCDESCHLENDGCKSMAFGAIWCPKNSAEKFFKEIRAIKTNHNLASNYEFKWNRVTQIKYDFYSELIDYFFCNNNLHFRTLIIPDKKLLDHKSFFQTHDDFYYKMYYQLLTVLIKNDLSYNIYIDIKDTQSQTKVTKLAEYLKNSKKDFSNKVINRIQQVRSHEVELIQLSDFFTGAVTYANRGLCSSEPKLRLISKIHQKLNHSLTEKTSLFDLKFNIFVWSPSEAVFNGQ